jgi:hypothetical protein
MKKTRLAITFSLFSLSTVVVGSLLVTTSCASKDKLIISGANKITAFINYAGAEDYQLIDIKTTEIVDGVWSLTGADADYFELDNNGRLS